MYITIQTLLGQGKSIKSISRDLQISRNTVRSIKRELESGKTHPEATVRKKLLEEHLPLIREMHGAGLTALLIHQRLVEKHGAKISYATVARCVAELSTQETYIVQKTPVGQEAQVDFGYLGKFTNHGAPVKVWVFCMTMAWSRKSYYALATNQKVDTFIRLHIEAFEYFGGVPKTVKLDNLKAGVITPDPYEPIFQEEYAAFLSYYGVAPIACRPARPQDNVR